MEKQKVKRRRFLGQINPDRNNRAFENKHLRAYIRGDKFFNFGYVDNIITGTREPVTHAVKQEYYYE